MLAGGCNASLAPSTITRCLLRCCRSVEAHMSPHPGLLHNRHQCCPLLQSGAMCSLLIECDVQKIEHCTKRSKGRQSTSRAPLLKTIQLCPSVFTTPRTALIAQVLSRTSEPGVAVPQCRESHAPAPLCSRVSAVQPSRGRTMITWCTRLISYVTRCCPCPPHSPVRTLCGTAAH